MLLTDRRSCAQWRSRLSGAHRLLAGATIVRGEVRLSLRSRQCYKKIEIKGRPPVQVSLPVS
jgi:hypothetical protein